MSTDPLAAESAAVASIRDAKRTRIVFFTLIEILTTLVFLIGAYAAARSEEVDFNSTAARIAALERENSDLRRQLTELNDRYQREHQVLERLWMAYSGETLPANPDQIPPEKIAEIEAVLNQQRQIHGGFARPRCGSVAQFLFQFDLEDADGGKIEAHATWSSADTPPLQAVPAIQDLASAGPLSIEEFSLRVAPIDAWSRAAENNCRFRVRAVLRHDRARLSWRQLQAIEPVFSVDRDANLQQPP